MPASRLLRSPLFDPRVKPTLHQGVVLRRGHPLTYGLIGAWLFNARGGYNDINYAAPSWPAAISTASTNVVRDRGALTFNGSQTSAQCPQVGAAEVYRLTRTALTVVGRVRNLGGAGTTRQIVECNGNTGWRLRIDTNNVFSCVMNPGPLVVVGTTALTDGAAHDMAVRTTNTGAGNGTQVFTDGKQEGSSATVSTGSGSASNLFIGRSNVFGEPMNGVIEHLFIWDRALRDQELRDLWDAPYAMFAPAVWHGSESSTEMDAIISVALSGALTTDINMAGSASLTVNPSGALTTGIQLVSSLPIELQVQPNLKTGKVGRALKNCGHPMFTKCERLHLGEES